MDVQVPKYHLFEKLFSPILFSVSVSVTIINHVCVCVCVCVCVSVCFWAL